MKLYDVSETARKLRVSNQTMYDLLRKGSIRSIKVGAQWRVTEAMLEEFLSGKDDGKKTRKSAE